MERGLYTLYRYWVYESRGIFSLFKKHSINPVFKGFMECFDWCFRPGNNYKNIGVYFKKGEKQ
ncbi:hypothetical protein BW897_16525 [Bacillus cereus]|uniref:Uncharacterized protein n=1 Tax=Bacillus cereus TaxID=1396 RepID=A0A1S9TNY4_BACCE|nr:hypothetical protein BW897_16525 [Bacillus cereus]